MALGNHPLFLESATKADSSAKRPKGPVSLQTPVVHSINFTVQPQEMSCWCWAAVAASIGRYYTPTSGWMQCEVANGALDRSDCCSAPSDPWVCNVTWDQTSSLSVTENLASATGQLSVAQVIGQLQAQRPIAVDFHWRGGGGHGFVIIGYNKIMHSEKYVFEDPWFGRTNEFVWGFPTHYYLGPGIWSGSYLTQAPPP